MEISEEKYQTIKLVAQEQYKQIGNAVPVNLAKEVGYSIVKLLNKYYKELKMK